MNIDSILVPTDFSADAEKAIETATELANLFSARLVFLHAFRMAIPITSHYVPPAGFYEEIRAHAKAQVEKLAKDLNGRGVDATGLAVESVPSLAIVKEAKRLGVDLIVMGTRGLTGIKHVALGSVAERVVRKAHCPVLTVKAVS